MSQESLKNHVSHLLYRNLLCYFRAREETLPVLQKRIDDFEEEDVCGLASERMFSKRIIGGREAAFGQYPWQAYIKIATYQCGGVLGKLH